MYMAKTTTRIEPNANAKNTVNESIKRREKWKKPGEEYLKAGEGLGLYLDRSSKSWPNS